MSYEMSGMRGAVAGVVFRRRGIAIPVVEPARPSNVAANVTVTLTRVTLGTERIEERAVVRAGSGTPAAVRISNPVSPGTPPSSVTDAFGFFFIPFVCNDGSLAVSESQSGSSASLRIGSVDGVHFRGASNISLRTFSLVPGGSSIQSALQTTMSPGDWISGEVQDQVTPEVITNLKSFVESCSRIAGLIAGITVPSGRFLLLRLAAIRIDA